MIDTVNAGVQPMQNLMVMHKHSSDGPEQKAWAAHFNQRGMQVLEELLTRVDSELGRPGRFAIGDTLTAADLILVPQVYSARRFGVDLAPYPRVLLAEKSALETEHDTAARPENQQGAPPM